MTEPSAGDRPPSNELRSLQEAVLELAVAQGKIANAIYSLAMLARQNLRGASMFAREPVDRAVRNSDQAFEASSRVAERLEKALRK